MNKIMKILAATTFAVLPLSAAFAQEANVQKLSDDAYSINVFGYTSLVVIGDKDVLVTDTANAFRAGILSKEIAKLTDKPVGKIVLSHEHFDHSGGTEVFQGAEIIAQENVLGLVDLDPLNKFPDNLDQTFESELDIDMGTTEVRLIHFGASDGVANTVVYLPEEKIVLIVDLYSPGALLSGTFLTDANLLGNRFVLNEVAKWDVNHAVDGHSASTDPKGLVAAAEFFNDLYDAVLPRSIELTKIRDPKKRGPALFEVIQTVKLPKYEAWVNYKDLPQYVTKMLFAIQHGG